MHQTWNNRLALFFLTQLPRRAVTHKDGHVLAVNSIYHDLGTDIPTFFVARHLTSVSQIDAGLWATLASLARNTHGSSQIHSFSQKGIYIQGILDGCGRPRGCRFDQKRSSPAGCHQSTKDVSSRDIGRWIGLVKPVLISCCLCILQAKNLARASKYRQKEERDTGAKRIHCSFWFCCLFSS